MPDWILRAATIRLDNDEDVGIAEGAYLSFKGVPLLPVPAISFPLSEKRKSGLLPLSLGIDNINGTESPPRTTGTSRPTVTQPPPTLTTNRGVDAAPSSATWSRVTRAMCACITCPMTPCAAPTAGLWAGRTTPPSTPARRPRHPVGLSLNINRASDNDYWRDFTRSCSSVTQRLLPSRCRRGGPVATPAARCTCCDGHLLAGCDGPDRSGCTSAAAVTLRYAPQVWSGFPDWSVDADFPFYPV